MPEAAGDCPKISLGEFFLDASVPNGPNYNTPELIGDLKKLTGPSKPSLNKPLFSYECKGHSKMAFKTSCDPLGFYEVTMTSCS